MEYLLLIVVILIILSSVTIPLVESSVESTMDISDASDAKNAIQSIANAVNLVYANGPGAKRTIDVYISQSKPLGYNPDTKTIYQELDLSSEKRNISAKVDHPVEFKNQTLNKGWHQTKITWPAYNTLIQVEFVT